MASEWALLSNESFGKALRFSPKLASERFG
jgi:hypothetical protein